MNSIIYTISTADGEAHYFMHVNDEESVYLQIDKALSEIGFCDSYEVLRYAEVTETYMTERVALIAEFEARYKESIHDCFCSGQYTTSEAIKEEIKWREENGYADNN